MRIRLIGLFIILVNIAVAQTYLGGTMLRSIPVADYGAKTLSEDAGFAMPGISVGAEITYYFNKHFGYGASFDFGNNPVDVDKWEHLLIETDVEEPQIGSFDYETFVFAGSFYSKLEVVKNTELYASANLGVLNIKFPARSYSSKAIDSLYNGTFFSEGGEGAGLMLGGEVGISYQIGKIKILAFCDYINSKPRFNYFDYYSYEYRYYALKTSMVRQGFQVFYMF